LLKLGRGGGGVLEVEGVVAVEVVVVVVA